MVTEVNKKIDRKSERKRKCQNSCELATYQEEVLIFEKDDHTNSWK